MEHRLELVPEHAHVSGTERTKMSMSMWFATDGGRRCPLCGKFAKAEELGFVGGAYGADGAIAHISIYGHLPGYGCNRRSQSLAICRTDEGD